MTVVPSNRSGRSGRRPGGALGWLLLPPWTRAPVLSVRHPAVILAVVVSAAVVALASSSAALFLSSASSESLRVQLAAECPDAAYPVLSQSAFGPGGNGQGDVSRLAPEAMTAQGLATPYRVLQTDATLSATTGANVSVQVFYREGATDQVTMISGVAGDGLLLPQSTADGLGVVAGDSLSVGGSSIVVVGVYRDLFTESPVLPYWCSYTGLFLNEASTAPPVPLVIASSAELIDQAGQESPYGVRRSWISPIQTEHLTLSEATRIVGQRDRAFEQSRIRNQSAGDQQTGLLPEMVDRTELIVGGLRGPVVPIAVGGSLVALLLVAGAGSYWVDRRIREVRLLSSRGVGPLPLAVKAVLELSFPAAAGTVLGWLLARWLIGAVGPSPDVDAAAPWQAALTAAVGLLVGLALLGLVAGLRSRAAGERPIGSRRSWAARVPWELALLGGSLASWLVLQRTGGVVIEQNVAQLKFLLVAFPLMFLLGGALLMVRLLALLVPMIRQRAGRWAPALFLAVARASASRLVVAGLLVAVALPLAVLTYSSALTGTSQATLEAKARVVTGSELAVISFQHIERTADTDAVGTVVDRYPSASIAGHDVTVLAVDPDTFARWAFWDDSFADAPLQTLLENLRPEPSGAIRAVATGLATGSVDLTLGDQSLLVDVVGTAATLPGRRSPDPLLIVDAASLGVVEGARGQASEIWSTRNEAAVRNALPDDIRITRVQDRNDVFRVANFLSVSWTFDYLRALAAFIGIVALGGLLLYLETRQRARIASYALARRMGLSAAAHMRSLLAELGVLLGLALAAGLTLGWVAVLTVYRSIEIDPTRPPPPLLTVPTATLVAAAGATVLVAVLATAYAQRAAERGDLAKVLRLGF
ncbi:MAG: FtsX-like permease family protein [Geodermatophilaceae bacterium]